MATDARCFTACALMMLVAGTLAAAAPDRGFRNALDSLPYRFEENRGQAPAGNPFVARSGNYEVLANAEGPVLVFNAPGKKRASLGTVIRGGNRHASISGEQPEPALANYMIGNDPDKWLRNVPSYGRVRYSEVYPSIDLIFHGDERNFEFDFEVKPGGDPARISLSWKGAGNVRMSPSGDLMVDTSAGDVRWAKPVIYQKHGANRTEIAGGFRVHHNVASFEVSNYDRNATLVIDPAVGFASYVGGSGNDAARAVAVDGSGNVLIAGVTTSFNLPTTSASFQPGLGGLSALDTITGDAFVAQLNPAGTALNWITYLGGTQDDLAYGLAVDSAGNAYITGMTNSPNFPVKNAQYPNFLGLGGNNLNPMGDAFVAKINSSGQLVYSTYFGGSRDDQAMGIAVDSSGNAYITGFTLSTDLPVGATAYQRNFNGSGGNPDYMGFGLGPVFLAGDAFAAKFDPTGKLVWTTYLGGSLDDYGMAIAVDSTGNVYVAGGTLSTNFPTTTGAYQTKYGGQSDNVSQPDIHMGDGFVAKLNPTGSALLYSTYLGGSRDDAVFGIAVDSTGAAYVTGATVSANFPVTAGAFQTTFAGPSVAPSQTMNPTFVFGDGFAAKLNATGTALVYATYFGGSGDDAGGGIAVDAAGNAYIVGQTNSKNFPVTSGAPQSVFGGAGGESQAVGDMILIELDPKGATELFGTYLGGSQDDAATGIALDASGNVYVSGYTDSLNFPATKGAYKTQLQGFSPAGLPFGDAFVAKITGLTAPTGPSINAGGVVPVYSTSTTIQPGAWFSIYGNNLAAATTVWTGNFPTNLGGTTVTVNNKNAYLWFVSAGQINAQAPDDTTTGSVQVTVTNPLGTVSSVVNLAAAGPAFLLLGDGTHVVGIIYTPAGNGSQGGGTYDFLGPTTAGAGFRPAKKGENVAIYAVGFGPTNPAVPSGAVYTCPVTGCASLVTAPQLTLGGAAVSTAFAGIVEAGLYQINLTIPATAASGDQALLVKVSGGAQTQSSVFIPVQ